MTYKIFKIISTLLVIICVFIFFIYYINPSLLVDIYRGEDQSTILVETKHLPIKKIISDTNFFKAPNTQWSPDGKHFSYFDYVRVKWADKEWALKIIDVRFFTIKTIFIGDYKMSEYMWVDDDLVRVYEDAGSGVRQYRDININVKNPIVAVDDYSSGSWTPEKTF
ncbi:MAG: hypothetical protein A3J93_00980 [Candidatus Magasanikbacteria bacterium RIFOXYC2_FULL_42_28]|uniref:Dipeptidylpeptidase IV N-terminal domain-containing protein n=1 Tax=Candidatus Magasanikbacteria bacterium RIFOXYC2_FULL_42_28 TaxID=1798704 RepID=A0A1F6NY57_9BACT|nr:MAG: hypothetical protein A3J93_00980 [Candidatus Magasanikbacteria bacterium RIFOXYC2_FULL_42_28]